MAKLAAEPREPVMAGMTGQMQLLLAGEVSWSMMREVYFNP